LQGDQVSDANWQVYLQPYGVSQALLLCPVRPLKGGNVLTADGYWNWSPDGEVIWNVDSQGHHSTNGLFGDYAANFALGGCNSEGGWGLIPGIKLSSVQTPATVVYTTDGGMAPYETRNPDQCIIPTCEVKYGGWVLDDPVNDPDSPDVSGVTSLEDPNWCGPLPRHGNFESNNGFTDGHVELMRPSQWYYGYTPWLRPEPGY